MRALVVTNTAVDLAAQALPFQPNNTVVFINATSGNLVVQESDVSGSGFATLATVPARGAIEVTLNKQFIKVSTAATVAALAN